jgi:hypothetical protein
LTKYTIFGLLGLGVLVVAFLAFTLIGFFNTNVDLTAKFNAKQTDNKVIYDNTWKIVQQQAGVVDKYQEAFREAFQAIMDGRYKEGEAQLAKIVTENNPNFESRLFERLFDSIEAQRNTFTTNQKELIAIKQDHDKFIGRFPNNFYAMIFGIKPLEPKLVTSTRTERSFETGVDDDTQLFEKKQPTPAPTPAPSPQANSRRQRVDPNKAQMPVILQAPAR